MRIKKIDIYIFTEVFTPFLGAVVFFAFVFLMFQVLRLAEFLIIHGVPVSQLSKLVFCLIVNFLPLGLTVAFLVGVLVAFSRFSGDSELVAMKASGMSMPRISIPVFGLSLIVALISFFLNMNWAPWSEISMRNILLKIGNTKFSNSIQEGTFSTGFFNLLLFTEKANNRAGKMEKVFIYDERDPKHPLTVVAKTGELIRVQTNEDDLGGMVMQLQDGAIHQSDDLATNYNKANFQTYQIFFDIPDTTGQFAYKPKMMNAHELLEKRQTFPEGSVDKRELDTEFWRRITVAMTPIFFVLLGMGFGTVRTRGARYGVLLIAFISMAIYWQVQVSAIWLGERGTLPGWLAMQIPNFLVASIGLFSFRRASW
jgi:LPS export ABC transporter permease LptF